MYKSLIAHQIFVHNEHIIGNYRLLCECLHYSFALLRFVNTFEHARLKPKQTGLKLGFSIFIEHEFELKFTKNLTNKLENSKALKFGSVLVQVLRSF